MMFMSACVVTTQLVIAVVAAWAGRMAGAWGRKPLLVIAFGALPVRGLLYAVAGSLPCFVGIQVLDGISAGIFSVVSVLVIADLTQGTGRFNLTLGAVTAAVGTGASLSQVIAGSIVHHAGYPVGFVFLSAVAAAGCALVHFMMPETRRERAPMKPVCAQPEAPLAR
jgi:MFS family permease